MTNTHTPTPNSAERAHADALAAHTANEDAIDAMRAEHTKYVEGEATAGDSLAGGDSSPAILSAITDNSARAATLASAIESLEAACPRLSQAVDRAAAEQWAEHARASNPQGTYAAIQGIRDELAEKFRADVAEARTRAEALSAEAMARRAEERQAGQAQRVPVEMELDAARAATYRAPSSR